MQRVYESAPKLRFVYERKPLEVHAVRLAVVVRIDWLFAGEFLVKELRVLATLSVIRAGGNNAALKHK